MKNIFNILVFLSLLLVSCGEEEMNSVGGEQFKVHFKDKSDKNIAEKVAFFWKENKLLTGKKQDLKLEHLKDHYEVLMIQSLEKYKEITAIELKKLYDLQSALNNYVNADLPLKLVICDEQFKNKKSI